MKISDHLVQKNLDCHEFSKILDIECTPVNIRLYKISKYYKKIILQIVKYMDEHIRSKFSDCSSSRGVSAPNLGFPLKIIGYKSSIHEINPITQFFLNPVIIKFSPEKTTVSSNNNSLKLPNPITVERFNYIDVEYYDLNGEYAKMTCVSRSEGSFIIQHEIDQINGRGLSTR